MRYPALDGLRGYLAWAVVATHLVYFSSADTASYLCHLIRRSGDLSALVFIVISGFSICHLVISKRESYPRFIARRILRLFPVYLAVLPLSLLSYYVALRGMTPSTAEYAVFTSDTIDSLMAHPYWHAGLNIAMLQGAVPDEIFPLSQFVILAPAWVLSLIWQFYLVAPLLVIWLTTPLWRWLCVALVTAGMVAYHAGLLGSFGRPSLLLGGGAYLLLGIALRLAMPRLSWVKSCRASRFLFESRLPVYLGTRSYSTYLIHYPIIQILVYTLPTAGLSRVEVLLYLASPTVVLVAVGSAFLYNRIELPIARIAHVRSGQGQSVHHRAAA